MFLTEMPILNSSLHASVRTAFMIPTIPMPPILLSSLVTIIDGASMVSTELALILRLVGTDTPRPMTSVFETEVAVLPSFVLTVLDAASMFPTVMAILDSLVGTIPPLTAMFVAERPVNSPLMAGVNGTLMISTELAILACLVRAVLVLASVVVAVALRVILAVSDREEDGFLVAG
jgi:hypothetical protein